MLGSNFFDEAPRAFPPIFAEELFRFSLPTSQLEEGTLASLWRWSQQCLRDVRKQMLIMPKQDYPRARPALQEKKTRIHTVSPRSLPVLGVPMLEFGIDFKMTLLHKFPDHWAC